MSDRLAEFRAFRERMNARILEAGNLEIKRFFALDTRCYEEGALDVKTKELLGLGLLPEQVTVSAHCTRCGDPDFFSHRGGSKARQMGLLGLREAVS